MRIHLHNLGWNFIPLLWWREFTWVVILTSLRGMCSFNLLTLDLWLYRLCDCVFVSQCTLLLPLRWAFLNENTNKQTNLLGPKSRHGICLLNTHSLLATHELSTRELLREVSQLWKFLKIYIEYVHRKKSCLMQIRYVAKVIIISRIQKESSKYLVSKQILFLNFFSVQHK